MKSAREKLINKIHQTEEKLRDSQRYVDRVGSEGYGYKAELKKIEKYKAEIRALNEELESFPDLEEVPAIRDYLRTYGNQLFEFIGHCYEVLPSKKNQLEAEREEFMKEHPEYVSCGFLTCRGMEIFNSEHRFEIEALEDLRFVAALYPVRAEYVEHEKETKYIRLVEQVKEITGKITDASCLRINEKGSIDGYIDGENGRAKVNTFEAGGWNIQRFHYRTKVTRIER